jgi:mediator of RNA polymerase II transcription subunit 16
MPLMMDDEIDMDDLFGDGAALSLPSRPPSKELYQRLDDLRGSGCNQYVQYHVSIVSDTSQSNSMVEMG